jgi:hypothetical protein
MEIFQIDDAGRLFISPVIEDWQLLHDRGIDTVIDLEGDLDVGVPGVRAVISFCPRSPSLTTGLEILHLLPYGLAPQRCPSAPIHRSADALFGGGVSA